MSSVWWLALMSGLQDGFCPRGQMAAAVFLFLFLWLKQRGLVARKYLLNFVISTIVFNALFQRGFLFTLYSTPGFQKLAAIVYFALAAFFFIFAVAIVFERINGWRGKDQRLFLNRLFLAPIAYDQAKEPVWGIKICFAGIVVVLGLCSTIYPINAYINIMTSNTATPGLLLQSFFVLLVHATAEFWLLILLAVVFLRFNISLRMQQVISAAIFLTASTSVIFFSKEFIK